MPLVPREREIPRASWEHLASWPSNSTTRLVPLDKLKKEITELGAKGRAFHYIIGDATESAEAKLEQLKAEGKIATGDEYQTVEIPWAINQLKGSTHIPEGSSVDPFADPAIRVAAGHKVWEDARGREEKWRNHIKSIEANGERYDPDKPKTGGWR